MKNHPIASLLAEHREEMGEPVSVQVSVLSAGKVVFEHVHGPSYRYFDLASLTKILFMVPAVAMAVDRKVLSFDDPVNLYLKDWSSSETRIRDLLTHQSGLDWWVPYYQQLDENASFGEKWSELKQQILLQPLQEREKALYSDVGVLTVSFVLEEAFGKSLKEIWESVQSYYNYPEEIFFSENNKPVKNLEDYAPTELCAWRKRLIQGEAHDENCWALGGVTAHAGLFASLSALQVWSQRMSSVMKSEKLSLSKMSHRAVWPPKGDWGLGFMIRPENDSSTGHFMGSKTFGHLGFTGTSWWHDPDSETSVIILSNRICPSRTNKTLVKLRPVIHDLYFRHR